MGLLSWIIVGLIAGWLASVVMRGGGYGLIGDIIVGIVGALLGGFLAGQLLGIPNAVNGINLPSILVAFLGAVVLIAILRAVSGRRVVEGAGSDKVQSVLRSQTQSNGGP